MKWNLQFAKGHNWKLKGELWTCNISWNEINIHIDTKSWNEKENDRWNENVNYRDNEMRDDSKS